MNIREALLQQSTSLALQRAASDEIAKLDRQIDLMLQRAVRQNEHNLYLAEKLSAIDPTFQATLELM